MVQAKPKTPKPGAHVQKALPLAAHEAGTTSELEKIARALALLWTFRPRSTVYQLLRNLGHVRQDGRAFAQDDVRLGLDQLKRQGKLLEQAGREGFYRLTDEFRREIYRQLLADTPHGVLRAALHAVDSYQEDRGYYHWPIYDRSATIGILRLALFTGTPAVTLRQMADRIARSMPWSEVIAEAAFAAFDGELFERIDATWRWELLFLGVENICSAWNGDYRAIADWTLGKVEAELAAAPVHMRLQLGELLMLQGEAARAVAMLAGIETGSARALRACLRVRAGQWSEAQKEFEAALKQRQAEVSVRKRVFPTSIAWLYPLCLLAQQTPKHLEAARKFCVGEAGKRAPDPNETWGRWVHVIDVRLGDAALNTYAISPGLQHRAQANLEDLWRLLIVAWLGPEALPVRIENVPREVAIAQYADEIRQRLRDCRLTWLEAQLDAALTVIGGDSPTIPFFVAGPAEAWRDVLAALQSLGTEAATSEPGVDANATRIVWSLALDRHGAPEDIQPLEQKRSQRGWGKPKPLSLNKIAGNERLPPWDARVARAVRQDRSHARRYLIDRAAAVMALIGHPAVVLEEAPDQLVELVEGQPEIEVVPGKDGFVMRVSPPLRAEAEGQYAYLSTEEKREHEALRSITVIQDSPQRLRVIRLTPAQRRAAQLVAGKFAVPAAGQDELQKTLRALAGHFQVQADHAQAAREVVCESRLRAELAPTGESLLLRLVVTPLGAQGPRLVPGHGRERLMAALGGETVGTRRELETERANLEAVLDALPFLDEPDAGAVCEWVIDDPDTALGMVETLPGLTAIAAVEWPKGKRVKVIGIDIPQMGITVKGEHDWFHVSGQVTLDEGLVLKLETLLAAAQSRSRFVPIGDGVYAALTRSLKQRLADLGALADAERQGVRIPKLATAWLDEALEGMAAQTDSEFRGAIERLHAAQDLQPLLPGTLQAELRPYQEDGFRWAMRLAQAGLGGCLADDMGLGKTLQALAVLLARAQGGPALVLAPTSVCGNWLAETQRFAPTLNMQIYGEGNRASLLAEAGPGDVVVVSYTLFQQAREGFCERNWHTVIADEAQAIKNATAKRSLAVFEIKADFRLALSGTPIENRLAELWSVLRFALPGLLGTLSRFNERFAGPIERNRDRDAQHLLRRLIAPFVLRRTKGQVLEELPPRTELLFSVTPDATEAAHYEALRRIALSESASLMADAPGQAKFNILAQLTRLRRAACDPRLATREFAAAGAKVQAFAELAAELSANGHKALVFSQFVDFLTLLKAPLDAAGISYQYLDGATPAAERTRRVAAFQAGEGNLFLISLKAGGFGLNLTAADYVVITDPWWNPAAEDQAMGRAHRMGQLRPVTVYRMVTRGTVEERIVSLHHDKRALAESVLAEGDAAALPSADDLIALIRGTL